MYHIHHAHSNTSITTHNNTSITTLTLPHSIAPSTYTPTGWRLGYLAAPSIFAKAAAGIQSQSTSGASSIAQRAALAALDLGPYGGQPVKLMVEAFEQRRVVGGGFV